MIKKEKIHFIINPKSGVSKKEKIPQLIEEHIDKDLFEYEIKYTQYRFHAKELAKSSISDGVDIVCAVGGDGSFTKLEQH